MNYYYKNQSSFCDQLENCIDDFTQYVDLNNEWQILCNEGFSSDDIAWYELEKLQERAIKFFNTVSKLSAYEFIFFDHCENIMLNLAQVFIVTAFQFSMELDDIIIPSQDEVIKLVDFRCMLHECCDNDITIEYFI